MSFTVIGQPPTSACIALDFKTTANLHAGQRRRKRRIDFQGERIVSAGRKGQSMAKKAKPAEVPREGVNTRITRELRDKLDEAATMSGRSVGSEIERRLENSFLIPDEFNRLLDDKGTIRVLCLIAQSWNVVEALMDKRWYQDQDTISAAKSAAAAVVGSIPPQQTLPDAEGLGLLNIRSDDLERLGEKASEFITTRLTGAPLSDEFVPELKALIERTARKPAASADTAKRKAGRASE